MIVALDKGLAGLRQARRARYNRFGEQLDDISEPVVASESYYKKTPDGDYVLDQYNRKSLDWGESKYGFDKSEYKEEYLKKGMIIIRYVFPHRDQKKHVLSYVNRGLRRLDVSEWSTVSDEDRAHI